MNSPASFLQTEKKAERRSNRKESWERVVPSVVPSVLPVLDYVPRARSQSRARLCSLVTVPDAFPAPPAFPTAPRRSRPFPAAQSSSRRCNAATAANPAAEEEKDQMHSPPLLEVDAPLLHRMLHNSKKVHEEEEEGRGRGRGSVIERDSRGRFSKLGDGRKKKKQ